MLSVSSVVNTINRRTCHHGSTLKPIKFNSPIPNDVDPAETAEWLESLDYVLERKGPERVQQLLAALEEAAIRNGVELPFTATTPYVNTIPRDKQPRYPGKRELERRIKSFVRWNAMAMVTRANRDFAGIGGHISTYASSANLYEVGFNHFFRGRGESGFDGDQIYFQGHASPGMYARAFLEGRLTEQNLINFRRELQPGGGLSSYPHPWLMPEFWEFPTVSMGLGPIMAIYQARFNRYLTDRGIIDLSKKHVWAFLGDGECDEPESLGAITLASREQLDNLIFVINCNLQRLDGPVRGNGKIIQELEGTFRGAGWNVIKVIWGDDWDPLLEQDETGLLQQRMMEVVDGQYQKYVVSGGDYIREDFFGKYPELLEMVKNYSDEKLQKMRRGGHDPEKVYAAFKAAVECKGKPTVILAKTIKGYGLGEGGEGRNMTHNQKKLNEEELREFRTRFGIPISDEKRRRSAVLPAAGRQPGNGVPARAPQSARRPGAVAVDQAGDDDSAAAGRLRKDDGQAREQRPRQGNVDDDGLRPPARRPACATRRSASTSCRSCPTNRARSAWKACSARSASTRTSASSTSRSIPISSRSTRKRKTASCSEEGITEAGSMSSFIAAGTAYSSHGVNMIPMFIYYSMFGFQRIGDLIWAAADARAKGFMLGGTAGRTTLNGEGLQHQDGHSLLNAIAFPTVRAYDPAYAYETAVIIFDGLKRLYEDGETAIYYITLENENYDDARDAAPAAKKASSAACTAFRPSTPTARQQRVQLFGSGAILREALRAQQHPGREVPHRQRRVERHQLHAAPPRRAGMRALEHAPPRTSRRACRTSRTCWPAPTARASPRPTTCAPSPSRSAPGCPAACSRWAPTAWAAAKAAPPSAATSKSTPSSSRSPRSTSSRSKASATASASPTR